MSAALEASAGAVRVGPDDVNVLLAHSQLLLNTSQIDAAREYVSRADARIESDVTVATLTRLGTMLRQVGEPSRAPYAEWVAANVSPAALTLHTGDQKVISVLQIATALDVSVKDHYVTNGATPSELHLSVLQSQVDLLRGGLAAKGIKVENPEELSN